MLAALQLGHAVISEPRHTPPHHRIAMPYHETPPSIAALRPAELEGGRQTHRHRDNRVPVVSLVPVLVQRQPGARRIAVDQARIRHKAGVAGPIRGTARELAEALRHRRPRLAGFGADPSIAGAPRGPAASLPLPHSALRPTET